MEYKDYYINKLNQLNQKKHEHTNSAGKKDVAREHLTLAEINSEIGEIESYLMFGKYKDSKQNKLDNKRYLG